MKKSIYLKDRVLSTQKCSFVMGIINANDDSFYEESRVSCASEGVERALQMVADGADILDLGAESTRPGSEYIDAETELARLLPIVEGIRKYDKSTPISVDTRKRPVMEACFNAGADILNDISALEDDETMVHFLAASKIPVILMHKRGNPSTMQNNTSYDDVVDEVRSYLFARADYCVQNGIEKDKLIFDVGIGFGKDLKSNLQLVRNCGKICSGYSDKKVPCLMALSRKSMISLLTGKNADDNLYGTLAANAYSIVSGADILRVHDVMQTVDMINVLTELLDE